MVKKRKKSGLLITALFILLLIFIDQQGLLKDIFQGSNELNPTQIPFEEGNINTFFCPLENCSKELENVIEQSNEIYCAFFDFDLENIEDALKQKNYEVIIDSRNHEEFGTSIKRPGYMHNKFCILDKQTITTGSMNPTENGDKKNNNHLLIIKSKTLSDNYYEEYLELKENKKHQKTKTNKVNISGILVENYFCPEDECAMQIINQINSAKKSIKFMTFSFTHKDVANALILMSTKGVNISGIFEKTQNSKYSVINLLNNSEINVSWDKNKKMMHHKVFIIDDKIVVAGSMNPSKNGDTRNDENMIIIHDEIIAKKFVEEFERLK